MRSTISTAHSPQAAWQCATLPTAPCPQQQCSGAHTVQCGAEHQAERHHTEGTGGAARHAGCSGQMRPCVTARGRRQGSVGQVRECTGPAMPQHTYTQRAHNTHSPARLPLPVGRHPGLLPFGNSAFGTPHHTTPHHTTPHHTTPHHTTPHHTTPHHTTPHHTTPHHTTPHHTTPHHTTPHDTTPHTPHSITQQNTTHNTAQQSTTQHNSTQLNTTPRQTQPQHHTTRHGTTHFNTPDTTQRRTTINPQSTAFHTPHTPHYDRKRTQHCARMRLGMHTWR